MPLSEPEIKILLQYLEQDKEMEFSQSKQRLLRKLKLELLKKD